jgi:hypothetical protein
VDGLRGYSCMGMHMGIVGLLVEQADTTLCEVVTPDVLSGPMRRTAPREGLGRSRARSLSSSSRA